MLARYGQPALALLGASPQHAFTWVGWALVALGLGPLCGNSAAEGRSIVSPRAPWVAQVKSWQAVGQGGQGSWGQRARSRGRGYPTCCHRSVGLATGCVPCMVGEGSLDHQAYRAPHIQRWLVARCPARLRSALTPAVMRVPRELAHTRRRAGACRTQRSTLQQSRARISSAVMLSCQEGRAGLVGTASLRRMRLLSASQTAGASPTAGRRA